MLVHVVCKKDVKKCLRGRLSSVGWFACAGVATGVLVNWRVTVVVGPSSSKLFTFSISSPSSSKIEGCGSIDGGSRDGGSTDDDWMDSGWMNDGW